jgi:hypothetical protein
MGRGRGTKCRRVAARSEKSRRCGTHDQRVYASCFSAAKPPSAQHSSYLLMTAGGLWLPGIFSLRNIESASRRHRKDRPPPCGRTRHTQRHSEARFVALPKSATPIFTTVPDLDFFSTLDSGFVASLPSGGAFDSVSSAAFSVQAP